MRALLSFFLVSLLSFTVFAGSKSSKKAAEKSFGGKMTATQTIALPDIIKDFEKHKGKTIAFTATTKKLCEKSGCWMVLKSGDQEVRTVFKDYGFTVPPEILNKKVKVQGIMEQKEISVATQRHYLKDAGATKAEIAKIKAPKTEYQFVADAVEIQ